MKYCLLSFLMMIGLSGCVSQRELERTEVFAAPQAGCMLVSSEWYSHSTKNAHTGLFYWDCTSEEAQ